MNVLNFIVNYKCLKCDVSNWRSQAMDQKIEQIYENTSTVGSLKEYTVKEERTVKDLLHDLNLDDKYFAILVNGKKANLDTIISEGSSIVVLPRIAGG